MVGLMTSNKDVFDPVTDTLCEFFEVAIHNILYTRKLYPESIFVRRKKYGIVVYRSVHPQLNTYIVECLKAVQYHSKSGRLRRLFVCIKSPNNVVERYVFDVLKLTQNCKDDYGYVKLEQNLRAFCLKLHTCPTSLDPLPNDSSFNIQLHTTEYSVLEFNENPVFADFPWIRVGNKEKIILPEIVPLQDIDTDILKLDIYVECYNNKPCMNRELNSTSRQD